MQRKTSESIRIQFIRRQLVFIRNFHVWARTYPDAKGVTEAVFRRKFLRTVFAKYSVLIGRSVGVEKRSKNYEKKPFSDDAFLRENRKNGRRPFLKRPFQKRHGGRFCSFEMTSLGFRAPVRCRPHTLHTHTHAPGREREKSHTHTLNREHIHAPAPQV